MSINIRINGPEGKLDFSINKCPKCSSTHLSAVGMRILNGTRRAGEVKCLTCGWEQKMLVEAPKS